jgi:hypothetical protein
MLSKILDNAFVGMLSLGHDSFNSFEVTQRCDYGPTPSTIATFVAGGWPPSYRPGPSTPVPKKAASIR